MYIFGDDPKWLRDMYVRKTDRLYYIVRKNMWDTNIFLYHRTGERTFMAAIGWWTMR